MKLGKFVIFNGKRLTNKERQAVENRETVVKATEPILLQMRTAGSLFTTRTVQGKDDYFLNFLSEFFKEIYNLGPRS